jgi:hypothetical protein
VMRKERRNTGYRFTQSPNVYRFGIAPAVQNRSLVGAPTMATGVGWN